MARDEYAALLQEAVSGYDMGDDGDEEVAYEMGDDDEIEVAYDGDVGAGIRLVNPGRRIIRRPAPRVVRRPAPRIIKRGLPARPPKVPGPMDRLYGNAFREAADDIPVTALVHQENDLATAATFTLQQSSPCDFVLTGMELSDAWATSVRNAQLLIAGIPVAGLPFFNPARFTKEATDRRLPPTIVKAGTPILLTATTLFTGGGTQFFSVDLLGTPQMIGLVMAARP